MSATTCPDGYTETGECFVIKTWENITPEQYEATPFTKGWPWCQPGHFPITYDWEAPCIAVDPCQDAGFGGFTLWEGKPCDPATHPYVIGRGAAAPNQTTTTTTTSTSTTTTTVVAVADPPLPTTTTTTVGEPTQMLPATGGEVQVGALAAVMLLAGAVLVRLAR